MTDEQTQINLAALAAELLGKARGTTSGRAARGVYAGRFLRQVLLTLSAGSKLAEHDSPPEATLQVIDGRVTLDTDDESWVLVPGGLMAIPPKKHSVTALEDSAFLLTIRTDISTG